MSAAALSGASETPAATALATAAIAEAAATAAVAPRLKRGMLGALHRRSRPRTAFSSARRSGESLDRFALRA